MKLKLKIINQTEQTFIQTVEAWMNDTNLFIVSIQYERGEENRFLAYITYRELTEVVAYRGGK